MRSSHPAGLLLRSRAGNLDRKLDFCPTAKQSLDRDAVKQPTAETQSRQIGAELRMTNIFSFIHSLVFYFPLYSHLHLLISRCTDLLFCDQLSLSLLIGTVHQLYC